MNEKSTDRLQVIIASGTEDTNRAVLGFALAVSAAVSGIHVSVFLTMGGTVWATEKLKNEAEINGFNSISDYIDILLENEATIDICTTCHKNSFFTPESGNGVRNGITSSGLTQVAIRACEWPTVTF